ncbi:MAG: hypothetical protein P9M14_17420, partial [Candidatus Alcyoniella australis]|nr:hypothetical protein [Candidatus Alcyoniella australis]
AQALYGQQMYEPARQAVQSSMELVCDQACCYLLLGKIEEAINNLRQAREDYCKAFHLDPTDAEIAAAYKRESLVAKRLSDNMGKFFKHFLPDPKAHSFRFTGLY